MEIKDKSSLPEFSVSLSVYQNDNPGHFREALNSIINQTVKPTEIVLVVDGPVPLEINVVVNEFESLFHPLKTICLPENKGHAIARQTGIEAANNELIALMDSDDISFPDRFEKQLSCFQKNPTLDVLGGQMPEFINSTNNIVGIRNVPLDDFNIKHYLKTRCPFNQVTVMFKKSSVLKVGGYIDWHYEEDYYLWIRMFEQGCQFQNLTDNLVYVRVGNEMYKRRGGLKYFKSEAKLQAYMWQNKVISFPKYIFNVAVRLVVQVLLPNTLRGYIFQKLFRKSK